MKFQDITGNKYNRLTAIRRAPSRKKVTYWEFRCDCGRMTTVSAGCAKSGKTKSCGCLNKEGFWAKTHGKTRTPEFRAWAHMKTRCTNKKSRSYPRYGGRGITVCGRWETSFENFLEDMGERPTPNHQIDRIDNDGDYEPENCRWVTPKENCRNRSTTKLNTEAVKVIRCFLKYKGTSRGKLAEIYNVSRTTIERIDVGTAWKGVEIP